MRHKSHEMNNKNEKWVLGHKVTPHYTTGDYDLVVGETPAKMQGPPPHFHKYLKESFLIMEGEMEFFVNGDLTTVKAGESVDLPPGTLHTFSNKSDHACKWVNIHSPKGFRKFFEQIGVSVNEENAYENSLAPEIVKKVMETAHTYDMIIKV